MRAYVLEAFAFRQDKCVEIFGAALSLIEITVVEQWRWQPCGKVVSQSGDFVTYATVGASVTMAVEPRGSRRRRSSFGLGVGLRYGGVAVVEAENENTPLALGFWVLKLHEPGVSSKPLPLIAPRPTDANEPITPLDNGG